MTMLKRLILLVALCALAACSKGEAVKLTYALGPTLAPCVGEVVILKFADKRDRQILGKDDSGAAIASLSDPADWVGWALFDELKAAGCAPKYRTSTVVPGDTPLVTGEVLEVSLNQTGTTTYVGKVAAKITVQRSGEILMVEKYTSEVEDLVVPGYSTESGILAETLRSLMAEVVPSVSRALR